MLASLWVLGLIATRIFLEDALCIGKTTFSSPLAWTHMLLWWISVFLCSIAVLRTYSHQSPRATTQFCLTWFWGILLPPVLDWAWIRRSFDYPYPTGSFWDYLNWMSTYMPTFVTPGQKVEITTFFALSLYFVTKHKDPKHGVLAVLSLYVLLSLYAWLPGWIERLSPSIALNHDLFCSLALLGLVAFQILSMRRPYV